MALSTEEAKDRAFQFKVKQFSESFRLEPVELPPPGAYFDPEGWVIFVVEEVWCRGVGGSEYVAVHLETGEVRSLGVIGE